jgi:hypothetical protein
MINYHYVIVYIYLFTNFTAFYNYINNITI